MTKGTAPHHGGESAARGPSALARTVAAIAAQAGVSLPVADARLSLPDGPADVPAVVIGGRAALARSARDPDLLNVYALRRHGRRIAAVAAGSHPDHGRAVARAVALAVQDAAEEAACRAALRRRAAASKDRHRIVALLQRLEWADGHPGHVVPQGPPIPFDATRRILAMPAERIRAIRDGEDDAREVARGLADLAPHPGPYLVAAEHAVAAFFGVRRPADVGDDLLRAARDEIGVREGTRASVVRID